MKIETTYDAKTGLLMIVVSLGEESYGIVRCYPTGIIKLYSIPQYGGDERFEMECSTVNSALNEISRWT